MRARPGLDAKESHWSELRLCRTVPAAEAAHAGLACAVRLFGVPSAIESFRADVPWVHGAKSPMRSDTQRGRHPGVRTGSTLRRLMGSIMSYTTYEIFLQEEC